jgi:hypothetical protein
VRNQMQSAAPRLELSESDHRRPMSAVARHLLHSRSTRPLVTKPCDRSRREWPLQAVQAYRRRTVLSRAPNSPLAGVDTRSISHPKTTPGCVDRGSPRQVAHLDHQQPKQRRQRGWCPSLRTRFSGRPANSSVSAPAARGLFRRGHAQQGACPVFFDASRPDFRLAARIGDVRELLAGRRPRRPCFAASAREQRSDVGAV